MKNEIRIAADTIALFCRLQMVLKKNLPIRSSEMGVLIFVHQQDHPVTPLMVSHFFQMAKPSVTTIINELVKKEYLTKNISHEDRRSYFISLTNKGSDLVDKTHKEYFRMIELLRDELGEIDFACLIELLERSNQVLSMERSK
ncbi:MarR family winged helix-turn-helix transcriptional regulator [Anoxynatronum sibiricum]|uniref:MarR family winged helix-turn-helix transcriptional regulator n=1 Tax=Anoxynatronum sibiricum TaxID=210623 RepID=A0ABU9VXW0_9CLOT